MSAPPAHRTVSDPDEATFRFWRGIASRVEAGPALWGFGVTLVLAGILLSAWAGPLERALRAANVLLRGVDVFEENGPGAYVIRDYLSAPRAPGGPEVAVLGASLTATTGEPDPGRRLDQALARELSARSDRAWRGVPLASDGFDTWSCFFVARLLWTERRPDVLVVGLDTFEPTRANESLVLAAGSSLRHFSTAELLPVLPSNRQPLYRAEAVLTRWFDRWLPFAEVIQRARPRGLLSGAADFARRGFRPARRPEARSWLDVPEIRAIITAASERRPEPFEIGPAALRNLERLGEELARCRLAGIHVVVVTLPRNPAIPWDHSPAQRQLTEWAGRHGLALESYWDSTIVPAERFVDTGHYDGEGASLVARALAPVILGGRRP